MKNKFLLSIFLIVLSIRLSAQVSISVVNDTLGCGNTCANLTAHLIGDNPTDAGVTEDDVYSGLIPIGFTFNFYGINYTQLVLGANGTIDFTASDAGLYDPWPISAPLLGNASKYNNICGPWCDIDIFYTGATVGTETYSTDGVAPFRKFSVTYCHCSMFSCGSQLTTSQIILYETSNLIEVHVSQKLVCSGWNGGYGIIGVQNATGTAATTAPGRDFPSVWSVPPTEAWRFTPTGGGAAYTVTSIPYAPIPYASSAIYWFDSATHAFIDTGMTLTVCPTVTTTYRAGALGCTGSVGAASGDTSSGYLTVVVSPCPIFASNTSPCIGDTLKLFCRGDSTLATYQWIGPALSGFTATTQNAYIYPASFTDTGTYMVIRTVGTRHDTAYTYVVIHPKALLTLSYNTPLCAGVIDTLHLTTIADSAGYSFSWVGPIGFTSTLQNPILMPFTTIDTGIYSVIATTRYGCLDTFKIDVHQTPQPPAPIITGDTVYCTNDTFIPFTVSATGTVDWYTTSTGGIGSNTAPTVNTASGGNYTYWASQVVGGCESLRDSIHVTVHVTPNPPTITGDSIYCQFYTYIPPTAIAAPPTATYETINWYSTATGGIGNAVPPTISTLIPGIYDIYASSTDSGCTSTRAIFPITVNPKPVPPYIVDIPNFYCPGDVIKPFDTVSGINITWYSSAIGGTLAGQPVVNTTIPGIDTFWTTQTVLGCISDRSFLTITIYPYITPIFTPVIKYGCNGDTVNLINTSIGAVQYLWQFGDGNSDTSTAPSHVYTNQGTYSITMYATSTTCLDSIKHTVTLFHPLLPVLAISDSIICQNNLDTFTNASTAKLPDLFVLNFGDGNTIDTNLLTTITHNYPSVGVYHPVLTVTDSINCSASITKTIIVDTISSLNLSITDSVLCSGADVTFTGHYASEGNTGIIWNFGNGDIVINVNPIAYSYGTAGTFLVTATALYRTCANVSARQIVTIFPQPEINLGPDTSICPGGTPIVLIDINNNGNPSASWLWNTGQTTSAISVGTAGIYKATVTINGCVAKDSVIITSDCYMDIPNVFTPNGDGLNDYFFPRQLLTRGLTSFKMDIYNRWGELIFESTSLDGRGWDGKFSLIDQPEGVYIYMIEGTFKDGRTEHHTGNITLLR